MNDTPNPIEVQKYLGGMDYPASRDELVRTAEEKGATDEVLEALRGMDDKEYDSPAAVSKGISS